MVYWLLKKTFPDQKDWKLLIRQPRLSLQEKESDVYLPYAVGWEEQGLCRRSRDSKATGENKNDNDEKLQV